MLKQRALFAACAAFFFSFSISAQEPIRGEVHMLNGDGTNPICFEGARPVIDSMWHGKVDASEMEESRQGAMLVLSKNPWATGALDTEFGQLLVDSNKGIYYLNRPLNDGHVQFGIPVPNDPTLIGQRYYIQAMVYGQRTMQLCNALDVVIGERIARPPQD